ncbi:uncharacterized protein [Diabrotica undecimpunctata]|uniref:uncharacterized protein n=1 Tax=Diabrotica undecimpunctata TaxID=50387 RepID=UPI003B63B8B1
MTYWDEILNKAMDEQSQCNLRMNMFGGNDCSLHRQMKNHEPRECTAVPTLNGTKIIHPTDTVLYHGTNLQDNRMVWATLTPRGTQHFISENYPPDLIDYGDEDHYETIDNIGAVVPPVPPYPKGKYIYHLIDSQKLIPKHPEKFSEALAEADLPVATGDPDKTWEYTKKWTTEAINNTNLKDKTARKKHWITEETLNLITKTKIPLSNRKLPTNQHRTRYIPLQMIGNADMRCSNLNTLRRHLPISRPRVSSPTRIEHPNLPPLNLYPHKGTLKKNGTLSYRAVEGSTLPKYGL